MANLEPHSSADANPFRVRASNSSRQHSIPVDAPGFDKDASHYDMSDHKYLIILNQHWFEKKMFKKRPSTRKGTYQDEKCLRDVFHKLGFSTIVLRNFKYKDIIDRLNAIVASWFRPKPTHKRRLEKIRVSCVCVAILTHGEKGGQIRAADQVYKLSEVMDIFGKEPELTNKPKLYFVQACRGGNIDAGYTVNLGTQSDGLRVQYSAPGESVNMEMQAATTAQGDFFSGLRDLFRCCGGLSEDPGETVLLGNQKKSVSTVLSHADFGTQSDGQLKRSPSGVPSVQYSASGESVTMQTQPTTTASRHFMSGLHDLLRGCGGLSKDPSDVVDGNNTSLLTVPSHADTLVVCSTVEEFLSYRDKHGSWMIQALCKSIEKNHENENFLDIIIQMHRTVAYDKTTYNTDDKAIHKKKQMPETRFTMTKHLKFCGAISLTERRHIDQYSNESINTYL